MSLREQVKKMINEDEDLNPEEFSNLILDELKIDQLQQQDKAFLEEFINLELLSMNQTQIKSTNNFPDAPNLVRLELNDNKLPGSELKNLSKYTQLRTLKFAGNLIKDFNDLDSLSSLQHLVSLDLAGNPIAEKDNYKEKLFEIFPNLQILDSYDRDGNEVLSEDEEDEDYDDELEGEEIDPETLKKMREEAGLNGDEEYDDEEDYGDEEEGEDDYGDEEDDDDEEDDLPAGSKRGQSNGNEGASSKRKK
ncbi:u2 snrnp-specific a protein [Stylonychia lemnae]|uniref:U2 snrnp-specific a protein n=1 Tax=Stylonychia lemnae TaxID=5949 RepID=A0A078ACA2_STYLE|nr:u2 snrnp-specific a protein [Stylonychia lemnae]|eukprot:CDW79466.1 u2 snrnp-specific a protein [Stylonychia lemnae]